MARSGRVLGAGSGLMFMLVSRRYERARLIVTSNKPFSAWGEIFGDDMAAVRLRQEPTEMGVANCVCC